MGRDRARCLALRVLALSLVQFVVGCFVVAALAQTPPSQQPVVNAERIGSLDARVGALERLDLGARLAVLEAAAVEARQVKWILYGVGATVCGNLIASILMIRGQRDDRKRA